MTSNQNNYTRLIVSDMTLMMSIGIYEKEKLSPQPVEIYIEAGLPLSLTPTEDEIANTVSYEALVTETRRIAALKHYNLVETFGETLCDYFLGALPITDILIRIKKPEIIEGANVGLEFYRSRT